MKEITIFVIDVSISLLHIEYNEFNEQGETMRKDEREK